MTLLKEKSNTKFAVIGSGVIGSGWVARILLMGFDVKIFDPDPKAEHKINQVLENARRSLPGLYEYLLPDEGSLKFCSSISEAVNDAQLICEATPESLDLKLKVLKEIQEHCPKEAIITSSTSGFKPSELQSLPICPEQIIVAHPFNPVYLIPLVELVGNKKTVEKASKILMDLGMFPLIVRKEIDAHIADRLLEAVWRESLWLINDGIATTEEIDDAIRYGFGLRWAQMGMFETYRIAGGDDGLEHFIEQFGPALKWPWTKLTDVPDLSKELINKITLQSDEQSGLYSVTQLERIRDDNLVSIMRALKTKNWAAGALLNEVDESLEDKSVKPSEILTKRSPVLTANRVVPTSWLDVNGHMNDSRYAEVFSKASDIILRRLGSDSGYIAQGFNYFTVDMQISYLHEFLAGEKIIVFTGIQLAEGKKLDLRHEMKNAKGEICATCKQLLIHVDLNLRKSCLPVEPVASILKALDS